MEPPEGTDTNRKGPTPTMRTRLIAAAAAAVLCGTVAPASAATWRHHDPNDPIKFTDIHRVAVSHTGKHVAVKTVFYRMSGYDEETVFVDTTATHPGPEFAAKVNALSDSGVSVDLFRAKHFHARNKRVKCHGLRGGEGARNYHIVIPNRCLALPHIGQPPAVRVSVKTYRYGGKARDWAPRRHRFSPWVRWLGPDVRSGQPPS